MGIADHKQKRTPYRGVRPLNTSSAIAVNRLRYTNGVLDMVVPCNTHHQRSFSQSAYLSGDFKTPNNHTYEKSTLNGLYATFDALWSNGVRQVWTGAMDGFIEFRSLKIADYRDLSVQTAAKRAANAKFLSKLRDSQLNLAVDIAEAAKTRKMMSNSVRDVVRMARQCRRDALNWARANWLVQQQRPSKERRRLRDSVPAKYRGETDPSVIMGNRWLEWQYGWKPLLSSIFGACDFERRKPRQSFRIQGNSKRRTIQTVITTTTYGFRTWNDIENSSYATVRCDYRVNNSLANDASRFTSMNPLAIAWELVPYSFVVDWFFDIGGYMQDLETSLESGLTFVRGYEVSTHRYLNKVYFPPGRGTSTNPVVVHQFESRTKEYRISKQRVRLFSTPLPFLPRIEAKLGAQRLLSAAALLRQLFTFRK